MKKTTILAIMAASSLMAQAHEGHNHWPAGKVVTSVQKTGNGQFTFETVPGFAKMPDGANVGPTHGGVAVDGAGHVFGKAFLHLTSAGAIAPIPFDFCTFVICF